MYLLGYNPLQIGNKEDLLFFGRLAVLAEKNYTALSVT